MGLAARSLMSFSWKYWDGDGVEKDWVDADALPNGADLFNIQFLNQFITGYNKRMVAINRPDAMQSLVEDGENAAYIQAGCIHRFSVEMTSILFAYFLRKRVITDAVSDSLTALSAAEMAILYPSHWSSSGPRATKTHPSDPDFSGWEYRYWEYGTDSATGDVCGPWIFEDLRMAIDHSTLARIFISNSNGPYTYKYKLRSGGVWPSSWTYGTISYIHSRSACDTASGVLTSVSQTILTMHPDFWSHYSLVPWAIVFYSQLTAYGIDQFDAQGTGLVYEGWGITNSGILGPSDGLMFDKYVMDPVPDPPTHLATPPKILSGFDAVALGLGFQSAFILFDISE